jgi:peptidylprolyl isomerase
MKRIALILLLPAVAAFAQTTPTPKTPAKPATTATKPATGARPGVAAATGPKLPPGIPPGHGLVKSAFVLRYQDLKIGTGPLAEPGKIYHIQYTGWLASDGTKFDSSYDHATPVVDKDGKPETDADGKPKMNEPKPFPFPQGFRRTIPGMDQGFEGMHIGGKRRLFIPYQLAYGSMGAPPKIPAKSDLIFDVELVEVTELPTQPMRPGMSVPPAGMTIRPGAPGTPPAPGTAAPPTVPAPAKPADPTSPATTPPPASGAPTPPPPAPTAPTAPPDKPANPAQPN